MTFVYCDGEYLCTIDGINDFKYEHSTIVSIDGISPIDFIAKNPSPIGRVRYDSNHSNPMRSNAVFSAEGGEPHSVVLKTLDGDKATVELHYDMNDVYKRYYGEYYNDEWIEAIESDENEVFGEVPEADEEAALVQTDDEKDLAYISISGLMYSSGDVITEKLKEYAKYSTIVIDLRGNGGGISNFYCDYVYPALYKDDARFEVTGYVPKNSYTKGIFSGAADRILNYIYNNLTMKKAKSVPADMYDCNNGEYYEFKYFYNLCGDSSLDYEDSRRVYYIANYSTCSAADEILQMVKDCDLGTVIGSNSLGEGRIFGVCCDWLPNSLLTYHYCPQYAVDQSGNSTHLVGTIPDEFTSVSVEGYIISDYIGINGEDWTSLESRELWDSNYVYILNDIGYDISKPDLERYLDSLDIAA